MRDTTDLPMRNGKVHVSEDPVSLHYVVKETNGAVDQVDSTESLDTNGITPTNGIKTPKDEPTKKLTNGATTNGATTNGATTNGATTNGDASLETKNGKSDENTTEKKEDDKKEGEEKEEEKKYEPHGSIIDVHKLYETKPDESGNTSWTKDYPESLIAPAEDEESAQYALIVRHSKCYDGRKSLSLHSIVVQSEPLKEFLGKVLANYPGVTTTLERLEFNTPFKPMVHRWEQFIKFRDEEQDPTTRKHVDLLHKIIEEELRDIISRKNDLIRNGVITHALIWTIFEPGDVMITTSSGRTRAFEFTEDGICCRTKAWVMTGKFIEYDGEDFGYDEENFKLYPFIGTTPITSLDVSPLKYHEKPESIRESLIARGKTWEEHAGYHYKAYEGLAVGFFQDDLIKYHVKSRIIIDTDAFNVFHPTKSISVYDEDECPQKLEDKDRLIASPYVHGYSLKDKEWLQFYLDCAKDIEWNSDAFESLVPPRGHEELKELILGIATAQAKKEDRFDDIVSGKGQGIIMQLSGPPGVGKTLTAECVAEVMRVPLYAMSAGELGISAEKVERSLKDILRMIPKWGAVLLLDEADVFMEARSATDIMRNELVSIFLRMLEYYEGILFLTTNRAENIDPAFESRIHLAIAYDELDVISRRQIWVQFLERTDNTDEFTDAQLEKLSAIEMNGRQIKNLLKIAGLVARSQKSKLGWSQIQAILKLRQSNAHKPTFYI
ncbi:hypothetical protein N7478_006233 [Penicillium angulare]|uniref:uncharacterized protein n=1 Tax=Penicillium angulare TaxID=116970 RepID=UPI00254064DE|nr:uncharacterized protein N7478_006233 [Penicillium angulare]KAJ5280861.1 hypothetical protein N7478_006233 [Penicillium angulare]